MKDGIPPVRLVIDTNVWLDWLVFDDPDVAPVKEAVAAGRAIVVMNEEVEAELARVLARSFGARTLAPGARAACLDECRRVSVGHESGRMTEEGERAGEQARRPAADRALLPVCADADDQKFLDLALACGADYLVTRDRDILELARDRDPRPPFRIVTPRQVVAALASPTPSPSTRSTRRARGP
ncbi:MAG: PIN domain-containing protein [Burkholderiales bacterium]|nr:PIN domain-containing protein [Burkholderiales bacterium]